MDFDLDRFIADALDEDVRDGDRTTESLIPKEQRARGLLRLRDAGVVAGIEAALRVFERLEPGARTECHSPSGTAVVGGTVVGVVEASARTVLTGERLALNLLGRLCGIATLTREFMRAVEGIPVAICDTRKTTPLLRALEKAAVKAGGGTNHRFGLYDAVLVKDNHLDFVGASGDPAGMAEAVRTVRSRAPAGIFVQFEARTEEEALAVAKAGVDSVLFDNFTPQRLAVAVRAVRAAVAPRPIVLEASGGVNLKTVRDFAATGVDRVSIGALTHSATSLDVTLDIEKL
jgi:nicotinate-nucleotide pyrophosphorylase (carboxylating)